MPGDELELASETLRTLHRLSARLARTNDEAEDLVQDALLAAIERKGAWEEGRLLAWASGVIRRRAMFLARTAARRRRRETRYAREAGRSPAPFARLPLSFIDALPPALRTVALLANAGLGREEIAHLLGISDAALRKRISDLRRSWRASGCDADRSRAIPRHRPPCGLLRRSLRSALLKRPDARFAIVDPDGHEIVLHATHKLPSRGN